MAIVLNLLFFVKHLMNCNFSSVKTEEKFTELVLIEIFIMDDCLPLPSNETGSRMRKQSMQTSMQMPTMILLSTSSEIL